jgi:DNA-directed RNA polymerase subunit RPC12/RpoP
LEHIQVSAKNEGLSIAVHTGDARDSLPDSLRKRFDSVITDPPYTLGALEDFLDRAEEALWESGRGMVALSFGHKSDPEQVEVQRILSSHRMAVRDLYSGFNQYLGAAILGGVSDLYILTHAPVSPPSDGRQTRHFYTAEARAGLRNYRCLACGHRVAVGPERTFTTIEALKKAGCPKCGKSRFRYGGS